MVQFQMKRRRALHAVLGLIAAFTLAGQGIAQVATVDPNSVFEVPPAPAKPSSAPGPQGARDAAPVPASAPTSNPPAPAPLPETAPAAAAGAGPTASAGPIDSPTAGLPPVTAQVDTSDAATAAAAKTSAAATGATHKKDDLIGAAESVFGRGAQGLAEIIEKILSDQGEPNAYIAGREASGAFLLGLRYGSGTLVHTVEGQRPVYWTGPSVGFDVGGDAAKTFILVYNLYDSQDLYKRYAQVEGRAYFVGGLSATYLRRGDVAIIPIRLGVGMRLGANVGYLKFTEKSRWLPF